MMLLPETVNSALSFAAVSTVSPTTDWVHLCRCLSAVNAATRASEACDGIVNVWENLSAIDGGAVSPLPQCPDVSVHVYAWWWTSPRHACCPAVVTLRDMDDSAAAAKFAAATIPSAFRAMSADTCDIGRIRSFFLQPRAWSGLTSLRLVNLNPYDRRFRTISLVTALSRAVASAPLEALRCFEFSVSALQNRGMVRLVPFLRSCPALLELVFVGNQLGDQAAIVLAELMEARDYIQHYSDDLSSESSDSESSTTIREITLHNEIALSKLEALSVERNEIGGIGAAALMSAARQHSRLRRLDLSSNRLFEEVQRDLLAHYLVGPVPSKQRSSTASCTSSPQLRRLSLAFNRFERAAAQSNEAAMASLVNVFRFLPLHHLDSVDLSGCCFPEEHIPALSQLFHATPLLTSVSFAYSDLTNVSALALVSALSNSPVRERLVSLNLHHNKIMDDEGAPFLQSLSKLSGLEVLDLGRNHLTEASATALIAVALDLSRLKHWHLEEFWFSTTVACVDFVAQLAKHPSLEVIHFALLMNCGETTATSFVLPKVPFVVY